MAVSESTPPASPISRERAKDIKRLSVISAARRVRLLSRVELTELTGLSPATLTPLVRDLIAEGYLIERGPGESRTGRPRAMLAFNPRAELVAAAQAAARWSAHGRGTGRVEQCWVEVTARSAGAGA